jgi:hypothetical protein
MTECELYLTLYFEQAGEKIGHFSVETNVINDKIPEFITNVVRAFHNKDFSRYNEKDDLNKRTFKIHVTQTGRDIFSIQTDASSEATLLMLLKLVKDMGKPHVQIK